MSPTPQQKMLLMGAQAMSRQQFINGIYRIIPEANIRFMHVPKAGDGTTSIDLSPNDYTITWDATIAGRLSALGNGVQQSYDGSTNFGTIADAAGLSLGNGVLDTACSFITLANVTDTANERHMLSKLEVAGAPAPREYQFLITTDDKLQLFISNATLGNNSANLKANSAIGQGAYHLFAGTYDGGGGATAANGMVLYQDAVAIAATATNDALYVAMSDTATPLTVGSRLSSGVINNPFQGSMALELLCQGVLSSVQLVVIKTLCNRYYRLTL